jgi:hypothetical protein
VVQLQGKEGKPNLESRREKKKAQLGKGKPAKGQVEGEPEGEGEGEGKPETQSQAEVLPSNSPSLPPELLLENLFLSASTADEIKAKAREGISFLIPKALSKVRRALDSPDPKISFDAAKDILDRSGLVKPQSIQIDTSSLSQSAIFGALVGAAKIFSLPLEEGEVRRTLLQMESSPPEAKPPTYEAEGADEGTSSSPPPTSLKVASERRKGRREKDASSLAPAPSPRYPQSSLPPELLSALGGSN